MSNPATTHRGWHLREKVLQSALQLFSAHGYFNTSIHDIRRHANVSIGSIYHHFNNKENLAKALFDRLLAGIEQEIREIIASHADCRGRCRAIVEYMFDSAEKEPAAMEFVLYAKHREFMPSEKPICSSRPFELMREIVDEGMARGELRRMDPWAAATALFGGPIRMVNLRLDGVLDAPLSSYLDEVWECAWRSVAA